MVGERDTQRLKLSLEVVGVSFFARSERVHIHWCWRFGPRLHIVSIHGKAWRWLDNGEHVEWKTTGVGIDTESLCDAAVYGH